MDIQAALGIHQLACCDELQRAARRAGRPLHTSARRRGRRSAGPGRRAYDSLPHLAPLVSSARRAASPGDASWRGLRAAASAPACTSEAGAPAAVLSRASATARDAADAAEADGLYAHRLAAPLPGHDRGDAADVAWTRSSDVLAARPTGSSCRGSKRRRPISRSSSRSSTRRRTCRRCSTRLTAGADTLGRPLRDRASVNDGSARPLARAPARQRAASIAHAGGRRLQPQLRPARRSLRGLRDVRAARWSSPSTPTCRTRRRRSRKLLAKMDEGLRRRRRLIRVRPAGHRASAAARVAARQPA